ncbi:MAG: tripartite tricarboxylate transporter TctB family protein [Spirochaetales bacterium]
MVNLFYGVLLAALAGVFFFSTFTLPAEQRGIDPRLYPQFISICLLFLSVSLAISGIKILLKRKAQDSGEKSLKASIIDIPSGEPSTGEGFGSIRRGYKSQERKKLKLPLALIGISLASFGYVSVIDIVGYLVATPPFIGVTMVLFGEKRIVRILLVSLLSSGLLYYLFRIIFRVPLPVSNLG